MELSALMTSSAPIELDGLIERACPPDTSAQTDIAGPIESDRWKALLASAEPPWLADALKGSLAAVLEPETALVV